MAKTKPPVEIECPGCTIKHTVEAAAAKSFRCLDCKKRDLIKPTHGQWPPRNTPSGIMGVPMTNTQRAGLDRFNTPAPNSPRWLAPTNADAGVLGDWFWLREHKTFTIFTKKVKQTKVWGMVGCEGGGAAGWIVGSKTTSGRCVMDFYWVHLLHSVSNRVLTLKVYRHQMVWCYVDSRAVNFRSAEKGTITPPKDRDTLVRTLMDLAGLDAAAAGAQLAAWTDGNA